MEWLAAGLSAWPLAVPVLRRLDNGDSRATLVTRPILAVVMKTVNQSEVMKSCLTSAWIVAGALVLAAPVTSRAINTAAPSAGAVNQDAPVAQNAPLARFSPGVADIVKMVDAKVDPEVVKTYIQHSPTAYNPSATEIIALKDHGVGADILTAMLQHGAEVRAQATRGASAAPNTPAPQAAPGEVNPYAPAYDYNAQAVYPAYSYTYPDTSYAYPSYTYAYPSYGYGAYNYLPG
jgi:multisubunit Na+/H+ antiporter MnhG subunit